MFTPRVLHAYNRVLHVHIHSILGVLQTYTRGVACVYSGVHSGCRTCILRVLHVYTTGVTCIY
jgi:hypothetical protein